MSPSSKTSHQQNQHDNKRTSSSHRENNTTTSRQENQLSYDRLQETVMQLQKTIGNQNVVQLLKHSDMQPDGVKTRRENLTGMPDHLKSGIENLSGMSMDHVRVHYQSDKPAQVGALAYAQGSDIHVASGQEKHLPHEAWHVVQQAQGRVKPTVQMKAGLPINDDAGLEAEADVMGARALQAAAQPRAQEPSRAAQLKSSGLHRSDATPIQLRKLNVGSKKLNNLQNALKIKEFSVAIEACIETHGKDRVLYFAGQLFSSEGEDIANLEQFMIELRYDLETKSLPRTEEAMTLQERYMTSYGWKSAANDPSKVANIDKSKKLKLYRTMSIDDYKAIQKGDYKVLTGGHIGDFKQALKYFMGKSSDSKVMVEFTLMAGAETRLFGKNLAFPTERSESLKNVAKAIGGSSFPVASKSEGTSRTDIGIKAESEGEAGFSIGIGGGVTPEKFQELVESVALKQVGERFSNENNSSGKSDRVEADANLLLHVNNCLINAISLAARGEAATIEELVAIRSQLNNYGEMLIASQAVVTLIQNALGIPNPITVIYTHAEIPEENFDGAGNELVIYHVNGNHFTHEGPHLD